MKIKFLVTVIPFVLILSGCSTIGKDGKAKEDLVRACELVNTRSDKDNFIPDVAIEFFASAAREDISYLPLLQSAKFSQLPPYDIGKENYLTLEVIKARSLITGYCTPRLAK